MKLNYIVEKEIWHINITGHTIIKACTTTLFIISFFTQQQPQQQQQTFISPQRLCVYTEPKF